MVEVYLFTTFSSLKKQASIMPIYPPPSNSPDTLCFYCFPSKVLWELNQFNPQTSLAWKAVLYEKDNLETATTKPLLSDSVEQKYITAH